MANWGTGRRVVVAVHNVDVADSFVRLLMVSLGVNAQAAYGAPEALELVVEFKPHLAFMDSGMPERVCRAVAHPFRELPGRSELALAAPSEWGRLEDRKGAVEAGLDRHYGKPIDGAALKRFLWQEWFNKTAQACAGPSITRKR